MADPQMVGIATLSITQAVGAFTAFLPPISEIRKNDPHGNPDFAADVRMGEIAACTTAVGVGVLASSLSGSPLPAYTSVVMCGILVTLYEQTLRRDRPMERSTTRLVNLGDQ